MPDSLDLVTIGDVFTLQRGKTYKSKLLGEPGPVLLGLSTIQRGGGFRTDSLKTYGGDSPDELLVQPGQLYVSLKDVTQSADLLGAVARLPEDHPPGRLTQDTVKLQPKRADVPLAYIYWLLRTPQYRQYCRAHATGTTNLGLPRRDFLAFHIPEVTESRRRIVEILEALDEKIELNRRMNETLEGTAQALFKSWFVDFDPVRAKLDGRWQAGESLPGLPAELYDLSPDRLVESELGEVPEGWGVVGLGEAIEINPTRRLKKGDTAPYLEMANMPTKGHVPEAVPDRAYGSGMRFVNGDTLLARITPCLENGKTAYVDFLDDGQVGWGSTEYIVLRARSPLPEQFAYCLARYEPFRQFAIRSMTGSSGRQRVRTSALEHYRLPLPKDPRIGQHFRILAAPLFERATQGARESRVLAELRDTLLPRLMSGELRVRDVESLINTATS